MEDNKKDEYWSLYDIDWNGDGKVDVFDDLISIEDVERTRKLNEELKDEGGWIGSCLSSLFLIPFLVVGASLKRMSLL